MSHLPILPIVIPLAAAVLLLLGHRLGVATKRAVSAGSVAALVVVALLVLSEAHQGGIGVYRLGNWPAPYGIVLMLDRLSALMVALTAGLSIPVVLASLSGADEKGRHYHAFLQLQLAGLNGAFLTGDLFNLFVFFEILLLASYALLFHGGGTERARAGLAYVIVNLTGSALFLIALGLVYGVLGTLNMADLTVVLPKVAAADQALVRTALALLVAVFLLKAAVLPLGFWLPHVYTAPLVPVSVLFVIMTKVGIYALVRVSTIGLGGASFTADLLQPWLTWLSVATIAMGAFGTLAAKRLTGVTANLVLISSGTLLLGAASGNTTALAAMLAYLVHTTAVTAALFLLADAIASQRGTMADAIEKGPGLPGRLSLGAAYLIVAIAACGAPPLSGFIAKLLVMQSLRDTPNWIAAWAALLVSGFVVALVLGRAASAYFWEPGRAHAAVLAPGAPVRSSGSTAALWATVVAALLLVPCAAPIAGYARATAEQIMTRQAYGAAVIGPDDAVRRERRP